ncbi:hypothetical protein [Archaeoglobus sp.]|uniref:hypothetical protein n=1 Tax=Archaeoglobus sp. TaxID=1872626 RepID=UPI0025C2AF2C|nr:hypothetical protein [Archaeoglobus sp.]
MLELASFALDIGNDFSKIRELGWEYILLFTLRYYRDTQLSETEIIDKTKETFGFENIPPFIVKEALRRLLVKKDIIEQEKRYKLTTQGINRITKILTKHNEVKSKAEDIFIKIFKKNIKRNPSKKEIDIVKRCLYSFLGEVFERWGSLSAKLLLTHSMDRSIPRCEVILDNAVSDIRDENLKEVIKLTIKQLLEKASKEETIARYISSIAQTYYLIQILNLDPGLKKLQKESLANVTVFLDTNIIIPLLCEEHEAHDAVRDVIKYTSQLGIKLSITTHTKEEFLRRLEYSNHLYSYYKVEILGLTNLGTKRVKQLVDDVFLKTFLKRKEKHAGYSWNVFLSEMKNFTELLKDKFGILLDDSEISLENEEFHKVLEVVKTANSEKIESAVRHDAINILFVDRLRQNDAEYELIGPRYWFLTRDRTLIFAETTLLGKDLPVSVFVSDWFDMVLPFISADVSKTLTELLKLQLIIDSGNGIDAEQVLLGISVLGPLINDPAISIDTIRKIVGSTYVQRYVENVRKLEPTELLDKAKRDFLEKEREKLRQEIHKEFRELLEKERERHKRKNILIVGLLIVLIILAAYVIYLHFGILVSLATIIGPIIIIAKVIGVLGTVWNTLVGLYNKILKWLHST